MKNTYNYIIENKSVRILIFCLLSIIPFLYIVISLFNSFLDDAYITLTYSKNLILYGSPHYNINDKIQGNGQTSILWMLLQSFFFLFKNLNHVYVNKIISIGISSVILYNVYKLILIKQGNLIHQILVFTFSFYLSFWLALNVSHGLETLLYSLFILLFLKYRNTKYNYIIVFLLPFVRPEGFIFSIIFIIDSKFSSKVFIRKILVVLLSIVSYLIYSYYFYDVLIPLPFLLKKIRDFSDYKILKFIKLLLVFLPVIIFTIRNIKTKGLIYTPLIFFIIYYSFFIDEVMNIFNRYIFPLTMYYLYYLLYDNKKDNYFLKNAVSLVSIIFILLNIKTLNNQKKEYKYIYSKGMISGPIYIGNYLKNESNKRNKKLNIINSDAGAIAYFSECNLYDTWGLNNATLLKTKSSNDWNAYLQYLKKTNPDYIVVISTNPNYFKAQWNFEDKIFNFFKLEKEKPVLIRPLNNNYFYFIYKIQ